MGGFTEQAGVLAGNAWLGVTGNGQRKWGASVSMHPMAIYNERLEVDFADELVSAGWLRIIVGISR